VSHVRRIPGMRFVALCVVMLACGGKDADPSQPVAENAAATSESAGKVVELAGTVTATRAGATRTLAVGNPVHADDVIDTGGDGSVVIELFRNNARWSLEAGLTSRVDESVAWSLPMQEAAAPVDHATSAAGRHADRQAADTEVTADQSAEREKSPETTPTAPSRSAVTTPPAKPQAPRPPGGGAGGGEIGGGKLGTIGSKGVGAGGGGGGYGAGNLEKKDAPDIGANDDLKTDSLRRAPSNLPDAPSRQDITRVMSAAKQPIVACANGTQGVVRLTIKIAADGSVSSVEIVKSLDPDIDSCVMGVAKRLRFPASRNGLAFTYPISLR